jgi:hypothetical protein
MLYTPITQTDRRHRPRAREVHARDAVVFATSRSYRNKDPPLPYPDPCIPSSRNIMSYIFASPSPYWISSVGRYQEKETTENLAVDRKIFVKPKSTPFRGTEQEADR